MCNAVSVEFIEYIQQLISNNFNYKHITNDNPYIDRLIGLGCNVVYGTGIGSIGSWSSGWKTSNAPSVHGRDYQSFYSPSKLFVISNGVIYIADSYNNRISKWHDWHPASASTIHKNNSYF